MMFYTSEFRILIDQILDLDYMQKFVNCNVVVWQVKISGGGRCNVTNGHCPDNMVRIYLTIGDCPCILILLQCL